MPELTENDVNRIADALAPRLVKGVKALNHEFWIDNEKHYKAHLQFDRLDKIFDEEMVAALKGMANSYKKGRNIFTTIFLTMVAAGSLYLAFVAWIQDKVK